MIQRVSLSLLPIVVALGGCVAQTAWDVATLPVKAAAVPIKVGGKVVDWTTTSQAEADRNYGRKMRKEEEREGRERRDWARRCNKTPDDPSCERYDGFRAGQPRSSRYESLHASDFADSGLAGERRDIDGIALVMRHAGYRS